MLLNPYRFTAPPGAPASARYWRIYITANNGDGFTSIQEVELRGTVGGADLTTPSTPVTASGYYDVNYEGYRAVDNNLTSAFTGAWLTSETGARWVRFDMGAAVAVAEIAIWPQNTGNGSARAPKDFQIQYSQDDATWTTAATFSGVTGWAAGTGKIFGW